MSGPYSLPGEFAGDEIPLWAAPASPRTGILG